MYATNAKLMKIEKAAVCSRTGDSRICVACEFNDARYHFWMDQKTEIVEPIIYKNPARDLKSDHPDYYNPRHLKAGSEFTDALMRSMLHAYKTKNLLAKFEEKEAREEISRRANAQKEHRIEMMRAAGPDLYAALKALVAEVLSTNDNDEETRRAFDSLEAAEAALKKASGSAKVH